MGRRWAVEARKGNRERGGKEEGKRGRGQEGVRMGKGGKAERREEKKEANGTGRERDPRRGEG